MTMQTPSVCDSCLHRITGMACEAFDVIPERFLLQADPHINREPGQENGITWTFAPGAEEEFDRWKRFQQVELP